MGRSPLRRRNRCSRRAGYDIETGRVEIVRYTVVDDVGSVLNPLLAEGQVHGGLAQGIGQALFEECVYDVESGPLYLNR